MTNLEQIFNQKTTENGDIAFVRPSSNDLANILFMTEYYTQQLSSTPVLEPTDRNQLFSMMIRDPRFGFGKRDLGRVLMKDTGVSFNDIVLAGRFDDIWHMYDVSNNSEASKYLFKSCLDNNLLCKKWMPRFTKKNKLTKTRTEKEEYVLQKACDLAKSFQMNKQQYGKFIKVETTESNLTNKTTDKIRFESVPSLAMIKYYNRFSNGADTRDRFATYCENVKNGKSKINTAVTTCYDIYKNRDKIDADLFFDKLNKISGSWIPIVDTSASMMSNDSMGKALSIGHYLSKCSTYAPNKVISFSSEPRLIDITKKSRQNNYSYRFQTDKPSNYMNEISAMYTGDISNTDFGKVMKLLKHLDDMPEYLIVLSDMEFDAGSAQSKTELQNLWNEKGYTTKIIWWNLNDRNTTAPEMDNLGNIFMSGYNPTLLKYLEAGFDNEKFINKLLTEYEENIRFLRYANSQ